MQGPYVQRVPTARGANRSQAPIAFLDRDGVINIGRAGYVNNASQMRLHEGAARGIASLKQAGYTVCIVTNQSPIIRGLWGPDRLIELHQALQSQLHDVDPLATIDLFLTCPHRYEDHCPCRKPSPGMLHLGHQLLRGQEQEQFSWHPINVPIEKQTINWWGEKPRSPHPMDAMVGDRGSDMGAGWAYGARLFRVPGAIGLAAVVDRIINEEDGGDSFQP